MTRPGLTNPQIEVLKNTQAANRAAQGLYMQQFGTMQGLQALLDSWLTTGRLQDPTAFVPPSLMPYVQGYQGNPTLMALLRLLGGTYSR